MAEKSIFEAVEELESKKYEGKSYIEDYEAFMGAYHLKEVSAEEAGEIVARMANHYIRHNLIMVRSLKIYNQAKREIHSQVDPQTSKAITTSKAEILSSATPEAHNYEESRAHVQNIEQCINALKSLQKGILNEYAYSQ